MRRAAEAWLAAPPGARRARRPARGGCRPRPADRARPVRASTARHDLGAIPRATRADVPRLASRVCSRAPSPMRSSVSRRAVSRSRPTSSAACPPSRSSVCRTRPARKRRSASEPASPAPSSSGRCAGSRSTSLLPGLRKEGSGYDLPIALAVLAASRQIPPERLAEHAAVGELALDGRLRPVPGRARRGRGGPCGPGSRSPPLPARVGARGGPRRDRACPAPAPGRGRRLPSRPAFSPEPASSRSQSAANGAVARTWRTCAARSGPGARSRSSRQGATTSSSPARPERARRCSRVVCPGSSPPLTLDQALEATRIHSVAGVLPAGQPLVDRPPFRAPHHTASAAAVVGGGPGPRPGEVSLAHHGVLLLDELPEFHRPVLEALRQPLEDGVVVDCESRRPGASSRPGSSSSATMNLCPCGARGDPAVECTCSPQKLAAYGAKLSRALLDRFDLVVHMPRPRGRELDAVPGRAVPASARACRCRLRSGCGRKRPRLGEEARALLDAGRGHAPAVRPRPGPRGAGGGDHRGARRRRGDRGGARGRGPLLPGSAGADAVTYVSVARGRPGYPPLLAELHDPPARLHLRGGPPDVLSRPAVAVVGARSCSAYGAQVARELAQSLAAAGVVVVSGLARGVDGRPTEERWPPVGSRSPCWAAESTATTRAPTPSSHAGSPRAASSSPSTRRASSRPRGASRRATGSSPASRGPRLWSKLGSGPAP